MHHSRRSPEEFLVTPQAAQPSFTVLDLLQTAGRHWFLVTVLAGALGAGGFFAASTMKPSYSAEAVLISDARRTGIVEIDGEARDSFEDASATGTVVETVASDVVIRRALTALPPEAVEQLRLMSGVTAAAEEGTPVTDETTVIARYISDVIEVDNSGRSYAIAVRFVSDDPALSAGIANAVAQSYVAQRSDMRRETYARMLQGTEAELAKLRSQLRDAESRAQTAREQSQLLTLNSRTLSGEAQRRTIAESAALFATQREAERDAAAVASVYERLLAERSNLTSRMDLPELNVQIFAAAPVPQEPSGMNPKPVLTGLGVIAGALMAISLGLMIDRARGRRRVRA